MHKKINHLDAKLENIMGNESAIVCLHFVADLKFTKLLIIRDHYSRTIAAELTDGGIGL